MMINRVVLVILVPALLVLTALFQASESAASEARASGLAGNPMVLDMVDIAEFPGLVAAEGNQAFLNATIAPDGNAGFLLGNNLVAGAWVNRPLRWDDVGKTDEIFNLGLPEAYNLFDFFLGTSVGLRGTGMAFARQVKQLFHGMM